MSAPAQTAAASTTASHPSVLWDRLADQLHDDDQFGLYSGYSFSSGCIRYFTSLLLYRLEQPEQAEPAAASASGSEPIPEDKYIEEKIDMLEKILDEVTSIALTRAKASGEKVRPAAALFDDPVKRREALQKIAPSYCLLLKHVKYCARDNQHLVSTLADFMLILLVADEGKKNKAIMDEIARRNVQATGNAVNPGVAVFAHESIFEIFLLDMFRVNIPLLREFQLSPGLGWWNHPAKVKQLAEEYASLRLPCGDDYYYRRYGIIPRSLYGRSKLHLINDAWAFNLVDEDPELLRVNMRIFSFTLLGAGGEQMNLVAQSYWIIEPYFAPRYLVQLRDISHDTKIDVVCRVEWNPHREEKQHHYYHNRWSYFNPNNDRMNVRFGARDLHGTEFGRSMKSTEGNKENATVDKSRRASQRAAMDAFVSHTSVLPEPDSEFLQDRCWRLGDFTEAIQKELSPQGRTLCKCEPTPDVELQDVIPLPEDPVQLARHQSFTRRILSAMQLAQFETEKVTLFQALQPMAVRAFFTARLVDVQSQAAGLPMLPDVLLQLIGEFAPCDMLPVVEKEEYDWNAHRWFSRLGKNCSRDFLFDLAQPPPMFTDAYSRREVTAYSSTIILRPILTQLVLVESQSSKVSRGCAFQVVN